MTSRDIPGGWTTWHEEADGPLILAFRPDIFDGDTFPSSCLPTVTVRRERRRGPRGRPTVDPHPDTDWCVELRLEPDVLVERVRSPTRERAKEGAFRLASAFANGEFTLRDVYEAPHTEYLAELETVLPDAHE